MASNQLRVSESELKVLQSRSDELAQALSKLAATPTTENLETAKNLLASFQSQFPSSMRLHSGKIAIRCKLGKIAWRVWRCCCVTAKGWS